MDEPDPSSPLLNVYEVSADGGRRHLLCFLHPDLAALQGIDGRSVLGDFTPGPGGEFDPESFAVNPAFVAAFSEYMNAEAARSPEMVAEACNHAGGWLYVLDPRYRAEGAGEPPAAEVLGGFAVDGEGRIVEGSFTYHPNHVWIDPDRGVSGVLFDRRFYDWLHPGPGPQR